MHYRDKARFEIEEKNCRNEKFNQQYGAYLPTNKEKCRVIKRRLEKTDPTFDKLTVMSVRECVRVVEFNYRVAAFIRTGRIIDAIRAVEEEQAENSIADLAEVEKDETCRDGIRQGVVNRLEAVQLEDVKKIIRFFGNGVDFTLEIRAAYSDCIRLKIDECARQIKETFPNIDFDSIENKE